MSYRLLLCNCVYKDAYGSLICLVASSRRVVYTFNTLFEMRTTLSTHVGLHCTLLAGVGLWVYPGVERDIENWGGARTVGKWVVKI